MTISAWAGIIKIALRLAKQVFIAEVRRGAKEIVDHEHRDERADPMKLVPVLAMVLFAGCTSVQLGGNLSIVKR